MSEHNEIIPGYTTELLNERWQLSALQLFL